MYLIWNRRILSSIACYRGNAKLMSWKRMYIQFVSSRYSVSPYILYSYILYFMAKVEWQCYNMLLIIVKVRKKPFGVFKLLVKAQRWSWLCFPEVRRSWTICSKILMLTCSIYNEIYIEFPINLKQIILNNTCTVVDKIIQLFDLTFC